jgi:hypothetical protein
MLFLGYYNIKGNFFFMEKAFNKFIKKRSGVGEKVDDLIKLLYS